MKETQVSGFIAPVILASFSMCFLLKITKNMTEYYINWSRVSGNYLVKMVGEGKILQVFSNKRKAEDFIKKLEEKDNGKSLV